jgi:hypothetical protein
MFVFYSAAIATGGVLRNGTSLSDVIATASKRWVYRDWLVQCLYANPGIYQPNVMSNNHYRHRAYLA